MCSIWLYMFIFMSFQSQAQNARMGPMHHVSRWHIYFEFAPAPIFLPREQIFDRRRSLFHVDGTVSPL